MVTQLGFAVAWTTLERRGSFPAKRIMTAQSSHRFSIRVFRRALAVAFFLVILGAATATRASDEGLGAVAARVFEQAEREDAELSFEKALAGYDEVLRLDPASANAARARARGEYLRARSEGHFEPFALVERIRREPTLAWDARAIDALVRAANGFPPGLVRVEAWTLAADAYASRMDRPEDAVPLWKRILDDPHADDVLKSASARSLVRHHLSRRDFAAAQAAAKLAGSEAAPTLTRDVRRASRRRDLCIASLGIITSVVGAAALAVAKAVRRGHERGVLERVRASRRLIFGYAAYVAIVGALLASAYQEGTARPFLLFGIWLVPLVLVARIWAAAGAKTRTARAIRAVLCAASVVCAGFLVLEHVDVSYLKGLGV